MSYTQVESIKSSLEQFLGKECLAVHTGGAAGSRLVLDFPPLVSSEMKIRKSSRFHSLQPDCEPLFSLYFSCSWRLDSPDAVLFGCWSDELVDGRNLTLLERVVGQRLRAFQVREPGMDLDLIFTGDLVLRAFCDQVNESEGIDNYSIFSEQAITTVATRSIVRYEHKG